MQREESYQEKETHHRQEDKVQNEVLEQQVHNKEGQPPQQQQHQQQREWEVYSRQQLVLGEKGLKALVHSTLCIVGVDGLGVEIAKNALLAGIHHLILCDDSNITRIDLSSNICLRAKPFESYKGSRAQECAQVLQTFNPSANIRVISMAELKDTARSLTIVCNQTWSVSQEIAKDCRERDTPVIIAFTGGLYYLYALDLGDYSYVDVQDNKQQEIPLINVSLLSQEKKDSTEKQESNKENPASVDLLKKYRVSIQSETIFPLFVGDNVDILNNAGEVLGKGTIISLHPDDSYFTLSSIVDLSSSYFARFIPSEITINYSPLSELQSDGNEIVWQIVEGIKAWQIFRERHGSKKVLMPRCIEDFLLFFNYVQGKSSENKDFYEKFYNTSFASTAAVNSIAGGLLSEEVVKILSKMFAPAQYLNGYHFFDNLYQENLPPAECWPSNDEFESRYASQILNFGKQFQYNLASKSILVVGAGALGNEIIKGMAMSGMCTRGNGVAFVVDNDLIMTSNISRQLCFSENDTHKTKADTLCHKASEMFNNQMRFEPVLLKLEHTSEDVIGHSKLSQIDLFVTALDNVSARNTVERISHMYNKPMVDGGTEGLEGSQENFVPNQTNEYYNPFSQPNRVVNCTPKPIVNSKLDVIHNSKLHFENILSKISENKEVTLLQTFLDDVKSVWEQAPQEMKNADGSLKGGKLPKLALPSVQQESDFNSFVEQIKSDPNISKKFFDKDEPSHVSLMEIMCHIVAATHEIPKPEVMEIRKKAGNIIPSIISTTAIISGFMLLNILQVANSTFKFANVNYGQSMVTMYFAEPLEPERKSIHYFPNVTNLTTFSEIVNSVPAPYPEIEECTLFGNSKVVLTGRSLASMKNQRVLRYLCRHAALGNRKYIVVEFIFRIIEAVDGIRRIKRRTKYLIITLPSNEVLAIEKSRATKEFEIASLFGQMEEANRERAQSLFDDIQQSNELELQAISSEIFSTLEQVRKKKRIHKENVIDLGNQLKDTVGLLHTAKLQEETLRRKITELQQQLIRTQYQLDSQYKQNEELETRNNQNEVKIKKQTSVLSIIKDAISDAPQGGFVRSSSNSPEPLKLYNKGNSCFLASCVQLLHTAQMHINKPLFKPTSAYGQTLLNLFQSKSESDWNKFVSAFYSGSTVFKKGHQDDSAKAFEAIVEREWVDLNDQIHVACKMHYTIPKENCKEEMTNNEVRDHYIVYAGSDASDADIANELIAQETYERDCDNGCGVVEEAIEFLQLPTILFMVASTRGEFLRAAHSFSFPTIGNQKAVHYDLIGASLHSGMNSGGHYTALVKLGNQWWSTSDSSSSRVDFNSFVASNRQAVQFLVFKKV